MSLIEVRDELTVAANVSVELVDTEKQVANSRRTATIDIKVDRQAFQTIHRGLNE